MFFPEHDCWLFMFLKPNKPIKKEDQNSETKTKTEATNLRLNWSNPYEKKIQNPSTHMKPKPNQTHQTNQPIYHHGSLLPFHNHQPLPISTSLILASLSLSLNLTFCSSIFSKPSLWFCSNSQSFSPFSCFRWERERERERAWTKKEEKRKYKHTGSPREREQVMDLERVK